MTFNPMKIKELRTIQKRVGVSSHGHFTPPGKFKEVFKK